MKSQAVAKVLGALALSASLTVGVVALTAAPAGAYGKANFQITFAGTGTNPGTGSGFGFWGWCDLAGSGTSGDCQITQYSHPGFTCHENVNLTGWSAVAGATIFISGDLTVNPVAQTPACIAFFPGSNPFSNVNTGFPATPGHYNLGGIGGAVGEFQVTVVQIP
jgi:hypothetical protein